MIQGQKHYYAFISHSVADEKTAKWLCKRLESYHIPTTTQKEYNTPKHLRPLFLFQTDLAGNKMQDVLMEALNDSLFLIVVCSPAAAKSTYANKGVQYFIDSGRYDKIIPFIIEGTPFASLNGNPEAECFPPALVALKGTNKELRGINLEEDTKHRGNKMAAVVDVIATMLSVRFDVLWDRYEKEQRRKLFLLISVVLCIILSLGYFLYRDETQKIIIENQYQDIKAKEERLREDSVRMQEQLDSIKMQNIIIFAQKDSLESERDKVLREQNNVKKANWKMKEKLARLVTKEAEDCLERGDSYTATLLMLEILPQDFENPEKPWGTEMEKVLRRASFQHNYRFLGHTQSVNAVAYSPDGKNIVSASSDGTICIWEALTGMCLHILRGHKNSITSISYSPDGENIVSASNDKTLRIWNAHTGDSILTLFGHTRAVNDVGYSPDGRHIASASDDETIRLWNAQTGDSIRTLHTFSPVYSASFSHDGQQILSVLGDEIHIWDVKTGDKLHRLQTESRVLCASFHPTKNNIIITTELPMWVDRYDTSLKKIIPDTGSVSILDLSTGKIIWRKHSRSKVIKIWNLSNYNIINSLPKSATCVTFSPDGKYIASANHSLYPDVDCDDWPFHCKIYEKGINNEIIIWNAATGDSIKTFSGHNAKINDLSFSRDGKYLVSASDDRTIRVWDIQSLDYKTDEIPYKRLNNIYINCTFSPNSKYYAAMDDNVINVCETGGNNIKYLRGHTQKITSLSFSPDGRTIMSTSADSTIRMWDTMKWRCNAIMRGHNSSVMYATFNQRGNLIASYSSNNLIYIWDVSRGSLIDSIKLDTMLRSPKESINKLLFRHNDNLVISTGRGNEAYVWDISTKQYIYQISYLWSEMFPHSIAYSPDGRYVASAYLGSIAIADLDFGLNASNPDVLFSQVAQLETIRSIYYSSNGEYIVVTSEDNTIRIMDRWGRQIQTIKSGQYHLSAAKFNPRGNNIISLGNKARIWDVKTRKCLYEFAGGGKYSNANAVKYSPDGNYLLIPMTNGEALRLYYIPPLDILVDDIRKRYKNYKLTDSEKKKYYVE